MKHAASASGGGGASASGGGGAFAFAFVAIAAGGGGHRGQRSGVAGLPIVVHRPTGVAVEQAEHERVRRIAAASVPAANKKKRPLCCSVGLNFDQVGRGDTITIK